MLITKDKENGWFKGIFTPLLILIPPIEYHDDTGENDDRDNVKERNNRSRPTGCINLKEAGERTGNDSAHDGDTNRKSDEENRQF